MAERQVILAAIIGAHGVTGEVRLKLFGEGMSSLKQHRQFNDDTLTLKSLRDDNKGGAIARFEGVADRTSAEKLRGTALKILRSALPALEEGEYYHADLIGLTAVSDAGEALGTVVTVENFGAGDVIEVERANGKKFMVPMRPEAVLSWDHKLLVVSPDFADA